MDVLFDFYGVLQHILLSCSQQQANTICLNEDVSLEMVLQVAEAARGKCVCSSLTRLYQSTRSKYTQNFVKIFVGKGKYYS